MVTINLLIVSDGNYLSADQIGLIDINKFGEGELGRSQTNQDEQYKANQSPGAFIMPSNQKSMSFFSPMREFSPVIKAPQSANRTNNMNQGFREGPSNYGFRNTLFGTKNYSFPSFKRLYEDDPPGFSADDDLFMPNDETLGMMWSNAGSKNPSANKVISIYLAAFSSEFFEQQYPEPDPERRLGSNSNMYQDELFREPFWQQKNENSNNEDSLRDSFYQVKMEANSLSQQSNREREEVNKAAGKPVVKQDFSLRDKKESIMKNISDDDDEDDDDDDEDEKDKMRKGSNIRIGKRMRKMDDGKHKALDFSKSEKALQEMEGIPEALED